MQNETEIEYNNNLSSWTLNVNYHTSSLISGGNVFLSPGD